MPAFWIVATLLTAVALAFVLVPLLRRRGADGPSAREANLAALRSQRQEIEADVALGVLPGDAKEEALADLVARASEDLEAPAETGAAPSRRPWPAAIAFAVLVPACAFGVYLAVGLPAAVDPRNLVAPAGPAGGAFGDHQMEDLVAQLAQKVRERPDDVQGWSLLARSFNAMGRTQDALDAYAHLAKIAPNDPQVLADYADALALARGKNLSGEPAAIIQKALQIDPKHPKSLALAGTVALNEGRFAESIGYWERLYAALPPDSQDLGEIRNIVEDVRARAAAAGKPLPPSKLASAPATAQSPSPAQAPKAAPMPPPAAMAPAAPKAAPVPGKGISGTVKLADGLAGRLSPTDTLFIYARAAQGSRMPLAILRGGAGELPKTFELDDSMGMAPNVKLSETASVVIEARVSKAGGAMAQSGDLIGTSAPVSPGAKGVSIVIDKVVP